MSKILAPYSRTRSTNRGKWWLRGNDVFWGCPECGRSNKLEARAIESGGEASFAGTCAHCGFSDKVILESYPEA